MKNFVLVLHSHLSDQWQLKYAFFFRAALILLNERDYRTLIDAINVVMLFSDVAS